MGETSCPVCGERAAQIVCPVCGFLQAERFAGEASFRLWQQRAERAKATLLERMQHLCAERNVLTLTSRRAACLLPESGALIVVNRIGASQPEVGVRQYSASERNEARLYADGTVRVTGDNEYRQCDTTQMRDIRSIAVAANCVYGVTEAGSICASGTAAKRLSMTGVRMLCCGNYHVAALLESGRVQLSPSVEVARNKGIKQIAAEGGDTLLVYENGRVAVHPGGNSEAERWTDIVAAAMDSSYIEGLSRSGRVLLASRTRDGLSPLLDMGRKDAADWDGIVAVSCCRSGIGAISWDGRLHMAGNIPDKDRIQEHWNSTVAGLLREELIRQATQK